MNGWIGYFIPLLGVFISRKLRIYLESRRATLKETTSYFAYKSFLYRVNHPSSPSEYYCTVDLLIYLS
jgi:hypothetical protein